MKSDRLVVLISDDEELNDEMRKTEKKTKNNYKNMMETCFRN